MRRGLRLYDPGRPSRGVAAIDDKRSKLGEEMHHAADEVRHAAEEVVDAAGAVSGADAVSEMIEYDRLGPRVWIFSAIMVVVGIVTSILLFNDFSSESYWYLAFYSIPANTAISLFPHEPVLIYFGKFANLWLAAAAATAGTVVAGYMDHTVFVPVLNYKSLAGYKTKRWYRRTIELFMKYPFATLVVTGFTPIPFFPFKFLSFSIHYPMWKYVTALVVARYPRYYLLALLGAAFDIPTWLLVVLFLLLINLYLIKAGPAAFRWIKKKRQLRAKQR